MLGLFSKYFRQKFLSSFEYVSKGHYKVFSSMMGIILEKMCCRYSSTLALPCEAKVTPSQCLGDNSHTIHHQSKAKLYIKKIARYT